MAQPRELRRVLGLTDVVLFNVVVIFSIRGMTTAARMGPVSLVLWALAVLAFFVPLGLAVTELATRDPGEGGFYRWTRAAFGDAHGFLAGWFYWVSNLTYLPSLLIFLAGAVAYVIGRPALGDSPFFTAGLSLGVLWFAAWLNVRGLEAERLLSGGGASAGWLAAVVLVTAGAISLARFGSATSWGWDVVRGAAHDPHTLAYFATLSFALVGLELAPVMGGEIRDPVRTLPRAILVSGVAVTLLYVAGTTAILVALPGAVVSPISGAVGAVDAVARRTGWPALSLLMSCLIAFSVLGQLSAWLGGMARLPLAVGLDRFLPPVMARLHPRHGTPHVAILLQAAVTSLFIVASQVGSTVREAFLVLLDATIVLNFVPFLYLFLALPRLRPADAAAKEEGGVVRVPGGRGTLWCVTLAGFLTTVLTLVSAVYPQSDVGNRLLFEAKLWGGLAAFGVVGYVLYRSYSRSYRLGDYLESDA